MPRSSKKNGKTNDSHPQEAYVEHRKFLIRSLERNDTDLAALSELNRTLRTAKEAILQSCGELVLLDLGAGRLTLISDELHGLEVPVAGKSSDRGEAKGKRNKGNDGKHKEEDSSGDRTETNHHLTPAQKTLCVDFLQRMKLRRKLSNRLARRLNRVAHAMDGQDVNPPPPPRYGDLRLNIDPAAVKAREEEWALQERAKQKIQQTRFQEKMKLEQIEQQQEEKRKEEVSNKQPKENIEKEEQADSAKESKTDQADSATESKKDQADSVTESKKDQADYATESKKDQAEGKEEEKQTETSSEAEADTPATEGSKGDEKELSEGQPTPMEVDSSEPKAESASSIEVEEKTAVDPASTTDKAPDAVESSSTPAHSLVKSNIPNSPPSLEEEFAIVREYDDIYQKVWDPTEKRFKYLIADQQTEPNFAVKYGAGIGAGGCVMSTQEKEAEHKRWKTSMLARMPEQPTFEELGLKNRVFHLEARRKRCLEGEASTGEGEDKGVEPDSKKARVDKDDSKEEDAADDTKEHMEQDEMDVDDKDDDEPVGAVKKFAGKELRKKEGGDDDKESSDTRVAESKPEEVEKTAKADVNEDEVSGSSDMSEDGSAKGDNEKPKDTEETGSGDDSSDMFGEDEGKDDKGTKKQEKSDEAEKSNEAGADSNEKSSDPTVDQGKEEVQGKKEVTEEPLKRIRPMSLAAIPSFHEQDMARIRMIHGDLVTSSMLEHASRRYSEARNDYNNALRRSSQLFAHRTHLTQQLQYFLQKSRGDLAKVHNDHARDVAIAKQRWLQQKHEHDVNRVKKVLPSSWGRQPWGSDAIQNYMRKAGVASVVGSCLADIVDGSIHILEGGSLPKKFDDFVPPPQRGINKQTGETLGQQQMRVERQLRQQLNDGSSKLASSEEERKRAWKKLMKASVEMGSPQQQYANARRGRIDTASFNHQTPCPPLHSSSEVSKPREREFTRFSVATYTPPRTTGSGAGVASDSKYSAAKIRDRISVDGTVAPVSEPKKTKDGLYQRPAGRTRKGMQWDAIRGMWVPEGSQ